MEEWKKCDASDFCLNVTDGTHDSPKPKREGYYLITSKHLKDSGIDFASANKISEDDFSKVIQRSKVEQYDILFSMIGTIGNIVQVTSQKIDFAVKNMGIFKLGGNKLKSKWLYYWFKSPLAKEYINGRLAGSTQSYLTLNSLRCFPVFSPSENEMSKIVSILSSLDDKIALNRRINDNLEQQAQALYKSWFVDFEPFKDGEFVDSELGRIPEGWRVGNIAEYCRVRSGYAFKSSWWVENGVKIVKIKNITESGNLNLSDCSFVSEQNTSKASDFKATTGDVLIAMTGATIGKFCIVPYLTENIYVNQRVGKFFLGKNPMGLLPFLYGTLKQEMVIGEIINKGQGSAQPNISSSDIESISIIFPKDEIVKQFNKFLMPVYLTILEKEYENQKLSVLRDSILPKLMSGELKTSDLNS